MPDEPVVINTGPIIALSILGLMKQGFRLSRNIYNWAIADAKE